MERKNKTKFYLFYSITFIFVTIVFLSFFIIDGKTLINGSGDGYRQNYRALLYYSSYLKDIFINIFKNHKLIIPMWDFSIGEGSDVLQTLLIDTIGGPIDFLSCLVPLDYIYLYHDFSIILRLYLAGISFSFLFINKKETNIIGLLIGSLTYVFCAYGYLQATNFFFFLKPLIEAPIIIVGIEKVINNEKPYLLIFSVALTLIFNFYSAYIIGVVIAIYTIVRVLYIDESIKNRSRTFLNIVLYAMIGILISAIITLPSIYSFIGNPRLGNSVSYNLFNSPKEIMNILSSFVVNDFLVRLFGGYSLICLFSLFLLFTKNGNNLYKTLLIICFVILFSPTIQRIFNAMSYPTERWVWAFSLLISCIVTKCYDLFYELKSKFIPLIIFVCLYFAMCIYSDYDDIKLYLLILIVGIICIVFISLIKNRKIIDLCTLGVTILCITINLFNYLSPLFWNQTYKFSTVEEALNYNNNESMVLNNINDSDFWRYDGDLLTTNSSMQNKKYATNFYWSCSNNYISEFRKDLGLLDHNSFHYDNYNERYSLMNLASAKYYIDNDKTNQLPYDYFNVKDNLYVNNNCLPMIYGYDRFISKNKWNDLDLVSKQESLLQAAVVETDINDDIDYYAIDIDYKIDNVNGLNISNNQIIIQNNNANLQLLAEQNFSGEHYIVIEGLDCDNIDNGDNQLNITVSFDSGYKKTVGHKDKTHTRYSDRHDYLFNLGYYDNTIDTITISFDSIGKYTYKSIKYVCLPMDIQKENVNKLNCVNINNLEINCNNIISNINIDKDKLVCFSIPYSKGWKIYVDGKKTELKNVNVMYLGAYIKKGTHDVELKYITPYFLEGLMISSITLVGLVIITIIKKNNRHQVI